MSHLSGTAFTHQANTVLAVFTTCAIHGAPHMLQGPIPFTEAHIEAAKSEGSCYPAHQ